ncbi:hypothetical protein EJD97_001171 [Solanum chilense]|uniref:CCHC-type domain-containing protein n=1 Tax=Solanum chilense TaxID=4083 RepID=A0A6N2BZ98_SOLCI|nr:hypothetical protein EJD97_001171 [Solanum chilense]
MIRMRRFILKYSKLIKFLKLLKVLKEIKVMKPLLGVKKHYGNCLACTSGCFGYGKDDHKARDCPTTSSTGSEGKQVAPNVPKDDVPKAKAHFYVLRARGSNTDDDEDDGEGNRLKLRLGSRGSQVPASVPNHGTIGRSVDWETTSRLATVCELYSCVVHCK